MTYWTEEQIEYLKYTIQNWSGRYVYDFHNN